MAFSTMSAQIAAHESWAKTKNRSARTAAAREAMMAKFEKQVDPDGVLSDSARAQMAESAKKAHYRRLAMKSAKVRSK